MHIQKYRKSVNAGGEIFINIRNNNEAVHYLNLLNFHSNKGFHSFFINAFVSKDTFNLVFQTSVSSFTNFEPKYESNHSEP